MLALLLPDFYVTLLGYVGLAAMVALGLVLLTGISGHTSFGQATFVGLAAYATTLLTKYAGAPPRPTGWARGWWGSTPAPPARWPSGSPPSSPRWRAF